MSTRTATPIDPTLSVNDLLQRWPSVVTVLNAYGIDTCCGGYLSLAEAAQHAEMPLAPLIADLERAMQTSPADDASRGVS